MIQPKIKINFVFLCKNLPMASVEISYFVISKKLCHIIHAKGKFPFFTIFFKVIQHTNRHKTIANEFAKKFSTCGICKQDEKIKWNENTVKTSPQSEI